MLRGFQPLLVLALVATLALAACAGASAGADTGNGGTGNGSTGDEVASLDEGPAAGASDGTDADASPAASVDPQEALLAFAACMREHGIDMPDPQIATGGGDGKIQFGIRIGGSAPVDGEESDAGPDGATIPDQETLEQAHEACEEHLAGVVGPDGPRREMSLEEQEQFLAFAKCMREHGVDMPDPEFGSGGAVMIGRPAASGEPIEMPDQETLDAAHEACQANLPGGGGEGGPGFRISSGNGAPTTDSSTDGATDGTQP